MKKFFLCAYVFLNAIFSYGQEKIFSLGYAKTFVNEDSSSLNLTFDLNRIPGQTEKAGGIYFLNEIIGTEGWGYYIKPTMDINIGSSVTSAPNNISIGLPIGFAYDFKKSNIGIFSWYFDGSPELVADKSFTNNLYYLSVNSFLKYELLNKSILFNMILGASNANGVRSQIKLDGEKSDSYGRITFPLVLKLLTWNASTKKIVNGAQKGKDYKRFSWLCTYKFNHVYSDNLTINKKKDYSFFNSKIDFYFTPNFGINLTYFNGNEEPIFKRNNSIMLGLTLAK